MQIIYKTTPVLKLLNFTDNTLLYTTLKNNNYKTNIANLYSKLDNISKWLRGKKLKLNTDKTRCIFFYSISTEYWKNIILIIEIDNSFTKKVNSYKYWGITIDSNLNWTEHMESLRNKLLKSIAILYETKYYL